MKKDHRAAFPIPAQYMSNGVGGGMQPEPGMTLREYFAIHALMRIPYDPDKPYATTAGDAVVMADALLAELARE